MKIRTSLAAALCAVVLIAGCSGRSSTQEATADCRSLAKVDPTIAGDTFKACVACFENCSDCEKLGTSPPTFACPGDGSGGSGGTGPGSTSTASSSTGG
jgi:hypothetical protein